MGTAYLAAVAGPGGVRTLRVVKRLRRELADDPPLLRMFVEEARITARLRHPNIVQTFDVGEDAGHHFIELEFLEGQTLDALFRAQRHGASVPLAVVLWVLTQALAGLHHAHEARDLDGRALLVVHRDVSPHNILVTYDGAVKVLDFGIAKAVDSVDDTRAGVVRGKIVYLAPEQARREALDRRVDVFAMGVILWQALTGERLWSDLSDLEICKRLEAGRIESPGARHPGVAPALDELCMRALAHDRDARYPTAAAFRAALEGYLDATGARVGPRQAGEVMNEVFRTARARMGEAIEEALRAGTVEPPSLPRGHPTTDVTFSVTAPHDGGGRLDGTSTATGAAHGDDRLGDSPRPGDASKRLDGPLGRPRGRRWFLAAAGAAVAAGGTLAWALTRGGKRVEAPAPVAAPVSFAVASARQVDLPEAMDFLAPSLEDVAFRALAARAPRRVVPPRVARVPASAMAIALELSTSGALFAASFRAGEWVGSAEGQTVVEALDAAAERFFAGAYPHGVAPTAADEADRERWGALDAEVVVAMRRAEVALARQHFADAAEQLAQIEAQGLARAYVAHIVYGDEVSMHHDALKAAARSALATAPEAEQALLSAAIDLLETKASQALDLPAEEPPVDPWKAIARAWWLASRDRVDEAFALADALSNDPETGGLGLYLSLKLASYYDPTRQRAVAQSSAERYPEEPDRWAVAAQHHAREDDLAAATDALAHAVALGADERATARARLDVAFARFDHESAARAGRQLLGHPMARERLDGAAALYAVDVLRGGFATARSRLDMLTQAVGAEGKFYAETVAESLALDALARHDLATARILARSLRAVARDIRDVDAEAKALLIEASLDRLETKGDARTIEALFQESLARFREAGQVISESGFRSWLELVTAATGNPCDLRTTGAVTRLARGHPLAIVTAARCELASGSPERALVLLRGAFGMRPRHLFPTLVVQRELYLGEALTRLEREAEARPHLERVLDFWGRTVDRPEPAVAERLLD